MARHSKRQNWRSLTASGEAPLASVSLLLLRVILGERKALTPGSGPDSFCLQQSFPAGGATGICSSRREACHRTPSAACGRGHGELQLPAAWKPAPAWPRPAAASGQRQRRSPARSCAVGKRGLPSPALTNLPCQNLICDQPAKCLLAQFWSERNASPAFSGGAWSVPSSPSIPCLEEAANAVTMLQKRASPPSASLTSPFKSPGSDRDALTNTWA